MSKEQDEQDRKIVRAEISASGLVLAVMGIIWLFTMLIAGAAELPPVPPGFTKLHTVGVAWDRNPETDIAEYRVYQGTNTEAVVFYNAAASAGWVGATEITNHFRATSAGTNTLLTITNLALENSFFVTAVNDYGLESDPSLLLLYTNGVPSAPAAIRIEVDLQSSASITGPFQTVGRLVQVIEADEDAEFFRTGITLIRIEDAEAESN